MTHVIVYSICYFCSNSIIIEMYVYFKLKYTGLNELSRNVLVELFSEMLSRGRLSFPFTL